MMISAADARKLKKTRENYISESLMRIQALIMKNAVTYDSVRYTLEEYNEKFYKEDVIKHLRQNGFCVELEDGANPVLAIRWDNPELDYSENK